MTALTLQAQPYVPGRVKGPIQIGVGNTTRDGIVIVKQGDLASFNGPCNAVAVIEGAPFSHAMIRLQGHAIPTIIISAEQAQQLSDGAEMVLDGARGLLFDHELLEEYPPLDLKPMPLFRPVETADGERIMMRASTSNRTGIMRSLSCGASAIGHLRMEYLGSQSRVPPGVDYFINELTTCCDEAEPLPVIARLPDFTSVKQPHWFGDHERKIANEGRGAQVYEQEPFKTLIDNILTAVDHVTEYHDLRLLLPYQDSVNEFIRLRDKIREKISHMVTVGAMLETANAVREIDGFLKEADLVAIGCNDLMADLLDCPREEAGMTGYEPAIYQLLQQAADKAGTNTREIQLNGQLPRMPGVLPVLIGLGYRIFSVDPLLIPYLAEDIKQTDSTQVITLAQQVCQAKDGDAVKQLLGLT